MKKTFYILFISLFIFSCGDNLIEEVKERYDDGKLKTVNYYKKVGDNQELVRKRDYHENGKIEKEENFKDGKLDGKYHKTYGSSIVEGKYENGKPYGIFKYFNNDIQVGWVDYDKYDKKFILDPLDLKNFMIGKWKRDYLIIPSREDTLFTNHDKELSLMIFSENRFEYKLRGDGLIDFVGLEKDSLYDWMSGDIDYTNNFNYKLYNIISLNEKYIETVNNNSNSIPDEECSIKIIDYFNILEVCKSSYFEFTMKLSRVDSNLFTLKP